MSSDYGQRTNAALLALALEAPRCRGAILELSRGSFGAVLIAAVRNGLAAANHNTDDVGITAEDVVQEVWLRLWKARGLWRADEPGQAAAYILTIARHVLIDFGVQTTKQRKRNRALSAADRAPHRRFDIHDRIDLSNALSRLSPSDRQLLELVYVRELPYAEISTMLLVAEPVLRQRARRALLKMKRWLIVSDDIVPNRAAAS